MQNEACSPGRVKGFLRACGRKIVNSDGEEVILRGPGLGNWLLPEGYMWQFTKSNAGKRADRPRRIEAFIRELTGDEYSAGFWKTFRDTYISHGDVEEMAKIGFNSLRIPVGYRVLMEDGEGDGLIEEGFLLIDRLLDWCEEFRIYAFIDLHGAPGGQTGANIDDCIDDVPRLFTDDHQYEKGLLLWEAIARRYKDRQIVGGYDLLNEPLAPEHAQHLGRLVSFYKDCVCRIRAVDKNHMFSIEGMKWATDTGVFEHHYDDNTVIHFHRYWCETDETLFSEWLELSEKLNLPLWLGESGENTLQWYSEVFPGAVRKGISWNFWPWKRMKSNNPTLCEITPPEGWDTILEYLSGGKHPGYSRARDIFGRYLDNIRIENINVRRDVKDALMSP